MMLNWLISTLRIWIMMRGINSCWHHTITWVLTNVIKPYLVIQMHNNIAKEMAQVDNNIIQIYIMLKAAIVIEEGCN
jgi:hypothetical protein